MKQIMKAVVKKAQKGATLESVPVPDYGKNEVLIKVQATAICGSDLHRYHWHADIGKPSFKVPLIMGHEFCGEIIEVGSNITRYKPGQIIVAETHIPCGYCYQCETGDQHICSNLSVLGKDIDGCFTGFISLPEICLRNAPKNLSYSEASLMEPLGVAHHAISKTRINGDTVVIFGCGPIGLMTIQLARIIGATDIIAVSPKDEKRDKLALLAGADMVIDAMEKDVVNQIKNLALCGGVGTVIEASGSLKAFREGLEVIRKGGVFVAAGLPSTPIEVDIARQVVRKELSIYGMHGRRMFDTWRATEAMVKKGLIGLNILITAELPLVEYEKGFKLAGLREHSKVILIP